jgi:hypothetical protein
VAYLPGHSSADKKKAEPEEFAIPGSSFLAKATYDATNYALTLDFKNGTQNIHRFVYPMVWQQFKEARSHGSFYSRSLKGKYPTVNFKNVMKVSDFQKLTKENHAPKHK